MTYSPERKQPELKRKAELRAALKAADLSGNTVFYSPGERAQLCRLLAALDWPLFSSRRQLARAANSEEILRIAHAVDLCLRRLSRKKPLKPSATEVEALELELEEGK